MGQKSNKPIKPIGRAAHACRPSKEGQSWGSEFILACSMFSHEVVRIATGPSHCDQCDEKGVIAFDSRDVPVCLSCGVSYDNHRPKPLVPLPPRNRLKCAKRFMRRHSH